MRRLMAADMFREITRPVVRIWKEAKRSDGSGNIYAETRRERGFETVHVLKGIRDRGSVINKRKSYEQRQRKKALQRK